jgi:RNA polymerase sigma factor (sigma-70 family)
VNAQSQHDARAPEFADWVDSSVDPRFQGSTASCGFPVDELLRAIHALSGWLRRHGVLRDDVDDVIQDALVRLCRTARQDTVRNLPAFLTTAVKRIRVDRWRCAQRERLLFTAESDDALDVSDPSACLENSAMAVEQLATLARQLDAVSPRTRAIFFWHRLEGRTYGEIAAMLGISVSAVEKHIARAAFALAADSNSDN